MRQSLYLCYQSARGVQQLHNHIAFVSFWDFPFSCTTGALWIAAYESSADWLHSCHFIWICKLSPHTCHFRFSCLLKTQSTVSLYRNLSTIRTWAWVDTRSHSHSWVLPKPAIFRTNTDIVCAAWGDVFLLRMLFAVYVVCVSMKICFEMTQKEN